MMRSYSKGKISLVQMESISDALKAQSSAELTYFRKSDHFSLKSHLEKWRHRIIGLAASIEAYLDFEELEVGF